MAKTILVKEDVYRILSRLKDEMGASSFNEVLRRIIFKAYNIRADMFGVDKNRISEFSPERDRLEDRDW